VFFRYAPAELRDDKAIVCAAVESTGWALGFASERLRVRRRVRGVFVAW